MAYLVAAESKTLTDVLFQVFVTLGVMTPFWITLASLLRKNKQATENVYQAVNQVAEEESVTGEPSQPTLGSLLRQVDKKIDRVEQRIDRLEESVELRLIAVHEKVDKGFRDNSLAHGEAYGRILNLESRVVDMQRRSTTEHF